MIFCPFYKTFTFSVYFSLDFKMLPRLLRFNEQAADLKKHIYNFHFSNFFCNQLPPPEAVVADKSAFTSTVLLSCYGRFPLRGR